MPWMSTPAGSHRVHVLAVGHAGKRSAFIQTASREVTGISVRALIRPE
jgi:hypothetical protein